MNTHSVVELQKKGILLHRLVYVLLLLQRLLLQVLQKDVTISNTTMVVIVVGTFFVVEEVSSFKNYFDSVRYVRILRYVECLLSAVMMGFLQLDENSEASIIGLILLFMFDLFLSMEVADKDKVFSFAGMVGVPIVAIIIIRMSISLDYKWLFLFLDMIIIFLILFFEGYLFVEYIGKKDEKIFSQKREFDEVVEKNENILGMQNKLKKTNDQLNVQRINLQKANQQIQLANDEMIAQAEILHYISMSFDLAKISNQITDSIMRVKQLSFCGVYIKEDVYLNKHASYVIKTTIGQLYQKIKESLPEICDIMVSDDIMELTLHDAETAKVPFLQNVNINSVYIKVLTKDEEIYGVFIIGDSRRNLFKENMSFYNAIIAQYDIAIHNAIIYGEMQQMARKDGLTGINNRIYFNELFKECIMQIEKDDTCLSVALFDIDKFKLVNDTYGHLAGDEVIKRVATLLEDFISQYNGFVCRYGGEEFVAALPGITLEVAQPIIEELFDIICNQIIHYNQYEIPISVSIGLTSYPEICKTPDELLKRADWCMYYAKEHGRHQINVDDGSIERV
ncbi:MAG: GGDEF domain-containing protein [Lachnospiraceae bacterium]|nr:GGDEF domain-containing protein [Lachnospiraceae bacterium]